MKQTTQLLLVVGLALALPFAPVALLVLPFVLPAFVVLVVLQIWLPQRLPSALVESGLLAHAATFATAAVRRFRPLVAAGQPPNVAAGAEDDGAATEASDDGMKDALERVERLEQLAGLEASGRYAELVASIESMVRSDPAATLSDPFVKSWLGRRWRNIFISEAAADTAAVAAASRSGWIFGSDPRPREQRVAERFLKGSGPAEWTDTMPRAKLPSCRAPADPDGGGGEGGALSTTMLLFCPGLINGLLPVRAFSPAMANVEAATGMRVLRAPLHPLRGCEANVADVLRWPCNRHATAMRPPRDRHVTAM